MEYKEWRHNMAESTEHRVLKTIGKILEENEGSCRLHAQDLDDLRDCWKILAMLHPNMAMTLK